MRLIALLSIASLVCFARCSSTPPTSAAIGTVVSFDLHADLTQPSSFWDFPYPSDLRLTPAGAPDVRGFPNDLSLALVKGTAELVGQRLDEGAVRVTRQITDAERLRTIILSGAGFSSSSCFIGLSRIHRHRSDRD